MTENNVKPTPIVTGGPVHAFTYIKPSTSFNQKGEIVQGAPVQHVSAGISMRDYFAAQAMQGMTREVLGVRMGGEDFVGHGGSALPEEAGNKAERGATFEIVRCSYLLADEMLRFARAGHAGIEMADMEPLEPEGDGKVLQMREPAKTS